jgi:hypothetical protein
VAHALERVEADAAAPTSFARLQALLRARPGARGLPPQTPLKPGTLRAVAETLRQLARGPGARSVASAARELSLPRVVSDAAATGLARYRERVALLGAFDFEPTPDQVALGRMIARAGLPLSTGAGNGAPHWIQLAARLAGGYTVGFAHAANLEQHLASGRPIDGVDRFYGTAAGPGLGNTEREAPLIQQNNIRLLYGGGIGTLCELLLSFFEPGVVGILRGVGGVNDAALPILKYLSLPATTTVVTADSNAALLRRARAALRANPAAQGFPSSLVQLGRREIFPPGAREHGNLVSFLVNDNGLSARDHARIDQLLALVGSGALPGPRPTVVVPERAGLSERVAERAVAQGLETVVVSPRAQAQPAPRDGRRVVALGKGEGVGEFAGLREVVEDARVVFAAGGDYKTLAGVAFAMNDTRLPVIAVLETDGGMSGHVQSFLRGFKTNSAEIVFDSDPARLVQKVTDVLRARASKRSGATSGDPPGHPANR